MCVCVCEHMEKGPHLIQQEYTIGLSTTVRILGTGLKQYKNA